MYHPLPPRRALVLRVMTYSAMVAAVVIVVTATVFYMLGYRFNRHDNQVEQGGLVQFISQPRGARVSVDGNRTETLTNDKLTLLPGVHDIVYSREGYRDYDARITVAAGRITWLNYARLIPTTLNTTDVLELPSTTVTSLVSPNRERMVFIDSDGTVSSVDIGNIAPKRTVLAVPTDVLPVKNATYSFQAWGGNRHVLVKAAVAQKTYWILVDVEQPSKSVRISVPGATQVRNVHLVQNGRAWYILADGRLYYGQADEALRLLTANVSSFSIFDDDTVLYTTLPAATTALQQVGVIHGTHAAVTLFSTKQTAPLYIAGSRYFNQDYLAIATQDTVRLFSGTLPKAETAMDNWAEITQWARLAGLKDMVFGAESRFVIMRGAHWLATYDIEWASATTTLASKDSVATDKQSLGWLDSYNLWSIEGAQLTTRDFTGRNVNEITQAASGFDVALARNGELLYSVRRDTATSAKATSVLYLQRTSLRTE